MSYMTTQKAQTLISDLIDEVIEVTDPEGTYSFEKYFKVKEMNRGEQVNYRVAGFGLPIEREILEDIDYDEPLFGEKQTIVPLNWARGFRVARETINDLADAGPWDGVNAAKLGQYADYTRRLKMKAWERVDLECALKLINGTSTATKYVGRDGVALFSASQVNLDNPPLTQSNLTSAASATATNVMTAIASLDAQRDDRGDFVSSGKNYQIISSIANRWKFIEITKTAGQVDTANNTVNALKNADINIKNLEVKMLDRANGASYTGWFVQNDNHELRWWWREKPTFDKNVDFDARALKYACFMRGVYSHADWRGIVGFPP